MLIARGSVVVVEEQVGSKHFADSQNKHVKFVQLWEISRMF